MQEIKISSLENINPQQHNDKQLTFVGSPMRIKKDIRIKNTTWQCKHCGNTYRIESKNYMPKKPAFCECKHRDYIAMHHEFECGFKIVMVNNVSDITSSETLRVFVPFKLLGIKEEIDEKKEIGEFLKNVGMQIEITGTLAIEPFPDKKDKRPKIDFEIIAEKVRSINALENYSFKDNEKRLREFCSGKTWTKEEIDKIVLPEVTGRALTKQMFMLTTLTPKKNTAERYSVGRGIIIGDPGEAKSFQANEFIKRYCTHLNAITVNNETSSRAGLMAAVVKDGEEWFIDWGVLTWANNGMVIQDGWHSFTKEDMAACREVESKNSVDLLKVVKGSRECAFRSVKIANTRFDPLKSYYRNKYKASFDIGTGEQDTPNKFSGADRRRVDWIIVYSKDDVSAGDVDSVISKEIINPKTATNPNEEIRLLIQTAWSLSPEQIKTDNFPTILNNLDAYLRDWREKYPKIVISILQKEGKWILLKYVFATAALFFRFDSEGNLTPTKEDLDYTKAVFDDMLQSLEVEKEKVEELKNEALAKSILNSLNSEQKELLESLAENGTVRRLCLVKDISRGTFYNRFKDNFDLLIPVGSSDVIVSYNCFEGYKDVGLIVTVPPIIASGLTEFGLSVVSTYRAMKK